MVVFFTVFLAAYSIRPIPVPELRDRDFAKTRNVMGQMVCDICGKGKNLLVIEGILIKGNIK